MKLSEYIILGSFLGHKIKGELMDQDGGNCALGAVMRSTGIISVFEDASQRQNFDTMYSRFPSLLNNSETGEAGQRDCSNVAWGIANLNNETDLSLCEIAQKVVDNGWDCEEVLPNQVADVSELQPVVSYS